MRVSLRTAALLAALILSPLAAHAAPAQSLAGDWRNAKNTVHIRAYPCGDAVCGTVIWASPSAEAKARDKGADKLAGTQIFREFRPTGDGGYTGKLFVPTVGRTFSGRLKITPDDKLVGKGCVIGGLFCKSTTWVRL
ncbi:DUF2147 domain-containing protein [Sphingomonas floccifaciens]|uniref:DUF2147 domain-containing protein n=1 Tax=Sphingomonas floccifaciens TaxID=1844115 RepID=A0ABW4NAF2_9SPHN